MAQGESRVALIARSLTALVVVAGALAFSHAPGAGAALYGPVADSYVDSNRPTSNYGTKSYMLVDASPTRVGYVKFQVSGHVPGTQVLLQLTAQSTNSTGFRVHAVADNSWTETGIKYSNAPPVGDFIGASGRTEVGRSYRIDVTSAVTGDGPISFAITSPSSTSAKYGTRESATPPLLLDPPEPPSPFTVSYDGVSYKAQSASTTYTGTLKSVVESAAFELSEGGGGSITFTAGTFDLGADFWKFENIHDVQFIGQGVDSTIITNNTSATTDTEPFNTSNLKRIVVRDMTVNAAGAYRSTSDALDFDRGDDIVVERVKITGSRGRGIVFDGKELAGTGTSDRNVVRDCVITNTPGDGIEMLASSDNLIENCVITNVGGHAIQATKASSTAQQPNKASNNNVIRNNVIDEAGHDGINVNGSSNNQLTGNTITNSANNTPDRSGIGINTSDGRPCNGNVVQSNVAFDNQTPKTQKYGLKIGTSLCVGTIVSGNDFAGNLTAPIYDAGTGTIYN